MAAMTVDKPNGIVQILPDGPGRVTFKPKGYLGGDLFAAYQDACSGSRFDEARRCQSATIEAALGIVGRLQRAGFALQIDASLTEALKSEIESAKDRVEDASERIERIDAKLRQRGLSLYGYQKTDARWLASRRRFLLSWGMGLGKTLAALITVPETTECGVLVVAPAVAKGVWKREAAKWRPEFKVTVISGRGKFRWPERGEILVMNYDILPKTKAPTRRKPFVAERPSSVRQGLASLGLIAPAHSPEERERVLQIALGVAAIASLAGFSLRLPPCPKGVFLISDESHALKAPTARRTISFRAISEAVRKADGFVGLLTATPQLNKKPQELWSVLEAADLAREAFGSWNEFVRLFGGKKGKWGYEWPDYSMTSEYPLPEAAERLRRVMIRRSKKDVLKDLPEKRYQAFEVDLDKGTHEACNDVLALLTEKGVDPESEDFVEEAEKILFTEISALRQKLATAKINALLALVEEHEENDEPCIVFSAHRAPIDRLAERPGWATITGDTKNEERTRIENDFQAGRYKGIGCTIAAGGVAITLTHASSEIFVDRAWTPALNEQAEDRAHRIGQTKSVLVTDLVGDHKIERRVHELLVIKKALIHRSIEQTTLTTGEPVAAESSIDFAALSAAAEAEEKRLLATAGKSPRRGPKTPREEWAKRALVLLAANDPDRAKFQNGTGFNATDGGFGHSLAAQVKDKGLTDKQWSMAIVLCSRYQRQVGPLPPRES
jgi:superfamily II DNA or RNA helicase